MLESFVFTKLTKDENSDVLSAVNAVSNRAFDPEKTTVMAANLSFYEDYAFLDILDHSAFPNVQRFALFNRETDECVILNFDDKTIQDVNAKAPIQLTKNSVLDYVRFYFEMVIGLHGKFSVVEAIDDIPWLDDPTPQMRRSLGSVIENAQLVSETKDGYEVKATVLFKSALFDLHVKVTTQGKVEIGSKDLLVKDMPVQDQALGY